MTPGRPGGGPGLILALSLLLMPGLALAQERDRAEPLTKSELIRLLVDSSLDQAEIAEAIRRACLTFEPDERDLDDLERTGAGPRVMEALTTCGRQVRLSFSSSREVGRAGGSVVVEARAERGGQPARGLQLLLEEGGETLASARTDDDGRARFRVSSGTSVERRRLRLRAGSEPVEQVPTITLDIRAGLPDEGSLTISPDSGDGGAVRVSARVRDAFGHEVPDVVVHLLTVSSSAGQDSLRLDGRTGSEGTVSFQLPEDRLPQGRRLVLVHERDTLAVSEPVRALASLGATGTDTGAGLPSPADARPRDAGRPEADSSLEASARTSGSAEEESFQTDLLPGHLNLRGGRPLDAVVAFRRALERRPGDGQAWAGLGRAWLAAGEPALAREAFREGRQHADDDASIGGALEELGGLPPMGRIRAFGGGGWRQGDAREFGAIDARLRPHPGVGVWAAYASSLVAYEPVLVRGGSDVATVAGGLSLSYGADRSVTTELSTAHLDHGRDLRQLVYRIENVIRFEADGRPLRWKFGGTLARWWDGDDWLLSTEAELPVAPDAALIPSLHLGETSGTAVADRGRRPATELRGQLEVALEPSRQWSLVPGLAYGRVSPSDSTDAGSLLEARLRLSVQLSPYISFLFRARHQRPPFTDPFSDLAAGLSYELR